jgi:hemolysin activation/secretion protein
MEQGQEEFGRIWATIEDTGSFKTKKLQTSKTGYAFNCRHTLWIDKKTETHVASRGIN